jgi:hypothetical protein
MNNETWIKNSVNNFMTRLVNQSWTRRELGFLNLGLGLGFVGGASQVFGHASPLLFLFVGVVNVFVGLVNINSKN